MTKKEFCLRIGINVAQLRKRKNMTQDEVGDKCGCSKQNISRLEHGGATPTSYFIHKLSEALETPVAKFFEGL